MRTPLAHPWEFWKLVSLNSPLNSPARPTARNSSNGLWDEVRREGSPLPLALIPFRAGN